MQSALDAAHRERDEVARRLDHVDHLIARLQQAVDNGAGTATDKQPAEPAGQKQAAKRSGKRTAPKTTKQGSTKEGSAKTAGRKTPAGRRGRPPAGEVSRSDRVVQVVAESEEPLTTGEVRWRLQQYEPDVSSKLASASLSYAQRKGAIRKTDSGRWVATAT